MALTPIQAAIRSFLDRTGESERSLSLRAGLHEKFVNQIMRGKMQSNRGVTLTKLADAMGLDVNDLLKPEAALTGRPSDGREKPGLIIREYDVGASAGYGAEPPVLNGEGETPILAEWSMPEDLVRAHTTPGRRLALIRVEGNSMEPDYHPGERVLVDLSRRKPSPPGEFVIWDGMGLVLKRVELVPGLVPRRIRLISINPGYTPYEVDLDEHTIIARVIGKWQWR
ncbi:LexA family transcriptional regulator [Sediminicoccus sp. KRV36]|uniref:LexA family transcriptional regulator n=1 Tax=Sediminicoccus sp. KRV36 TaxID=3133721 RepID=UPI00200D8124|nr:LexA family transcriptional regulator [Sediminicoccus rosea]UPY35514.1 helix-turn-helix domain-containing protein [Sediminicoccus rosea]